MVAESCSSKVERIGLSRRHMPAPPTVDHVGGFSAARRGCVLPPAAGDFDGGERAEDTDQCSGDQGQERALHGSSIVPRWLVLRCRICRRPIGRAALGSGSAVQARCRRDRLTFVFVLAPDGRLVSPAFGEATGETTSQMGQEMSQAGQKMSGTGEKKSGPEIESPAPATVPDMSPPTEGNPDDNAQPAARPAGVAEPGAGGPAPAVQPAGAPKPAVPDVQAGPTQPPGPPKPPTRAGRTMSESQAAYGDGVGILSAQHCPTCRCHPEMRPSGEDRSALDATDHSGKAAGVCSGEPIEKPDDVRNNERTGARQRPLGPLHTDSGRRWLLDFKNGEVREIPLRSEAEDSKPNSFPIHE